MYNKISNEKSNESKKIQIEPRCVNEKNVPEFKEILCPKNFKPLSTEICKNCFDKKMLERKHHSGKKLSAIICTWDINNNST